MTQDRAPQAMRELVKAAAIEGVCIAGGVAGFLASGNWVWLAGGVLLGLGFSLPAIIAYLRAKR